MAKKPTPPKDEVLLAALEKVYAARSKFFYEKVRCAPFEGLVAQVKGAKVSGLNWQDPALGISPAARRRLEDAGIPLHFVFCHPVLVSGKRDLIIYYRNLAALSQKGLNQLLQGSTNRNHDACRAINNILSSVVEASPNFSLQPARDVMLAELGTEIQGAWVNLIGSGAAKKVAEMLTSYAQRHRLSGTIESRRIKVGEKFQIQVWHNLKNGWRIVFSTEPDVAIFDDADKLRVAIEIKGSMDKAGAQTRYGEAKKSFGKALAANPRCETIYLASCFTESVLKQIEADGQVRKTYNLVDILEDRRQRRKFLEELFKYLIRAQK